MVDALTEKIIDKKELRGLSVDFARRAVQEWLDQHPDVREEYEKDPERFFRKKSFQDIRSDVREHLRRVYGVFFTNQYPAKRDALVDALIQHPSKENARALLSIHRSTNERLSAYETLYKEIFAVTGIPESILDMGCGFNPFAYPFLGCTPDYYSADIACEDLERIQQFHTSLGIAHKQYCLDLTRPEATKKLPVADVAFAFKVFDSLEEKQRDITVQILSQIRADYLVASFPTMSIGQKKVIGPRKWFEEIVTDKVAGRVTLVNEQFIIITLKQKEDVTHT